MVSWSTWSFMYDMCTSDLSFWTMVSWSLPGSSCMTCVHQILPLGLSGSSCMKICTSDLSFWTVVSWSLPGPSCMTCVHQIFPSELMVSWSLPGPFMYDMCTSDLSFWTMVSWSTYWSCVHQIFPSELWFLGLYLVLYVWHVYIRSFLLNYGFLVSTCPSCMTCVHQIFPSELWFLGLYLVLHVWHVYIRSFLLNYGFLVSTWSFMYDMCTSDLSFWTMVSWSTWSFMYMTCVHQIFPSELWFLGLYLVLHVYDMCTSDLSFWTILGFYLVWHVYIRSIPSELWFLGLHVYDMCTSDLFLLNYGFLVSTWSFMYMTCVHQIFPSELWFLGLYLVLHVWHVYIRSFLLNYSWSSLYDMCTSDLSFWTVGSWSLPVPSCIWHVYIRSFLLNYGFFYLVLYVWHVYIRSFLLICGFLVIWFFMYDMCTSDLSFWTMVSWSGPSCMICVHQIFTSELWFLGLYLDLVWHVYIRFFLLNYGFLVYLVLHVYDMCTSDLSFWTMVSWSLPGPSCMTCVHQIFPSELWFFGLYLVLHVWHVYIRSFLLNYGFLVSTWSFMYDMCTSDLSFWTMVSWYLPGSFMYDMCTSDLSFWTMVSWSLPGSCMTCVHHFPSELWFLGLYGPLCMTCVHQIFPSELWFLGLYLVLHVWHVYIRSFLLNYGFLVYLVPHVWHVYIRSFLLNYGFLVSTWSFMYDMCTSDLSFWTMVSWSLVLHV